MIKVIYEDELPVTLIPQNDGMVAVKSPYNKQFVEELKRYIPSKFRKWDADQRLWFVSEERISSLLKPIKDVFGQTIRITHICDYIPVQETRTFQVYYLGNAKMRDCDAAEEACLAHTVPELDSYAEIPVSVLRAWFDTRYQAADSIGDVSVKEFNPYAVLGIIAQDFTQVTKEEIRKRYRVCARTYHPDLNPGNKEAEEKFKEINNANEILSDPQKRQWYHASVAFAKSVEISKQPQRKNYHVAGKINYLPPIRCGNVTASGKFIAGKFVVDKILAWDDITNGNGDVLVTSWCASYVKEEWVCTL